jgi:hypothetical protein
MDMLVKLYYLPKSCAVFERLGEQGIEWPAIIGRARRY